MAKHKVSELEGALLDAAVEMAERHTGKDHRLERMGMGLMMKTLGVRPFSTDWQHGGPIIQRERIAVMPRDDGQPWRAAAWLPPDASVMVYGKGPTPLIAAMRAYVSSKFGEEVELP